mgnify:CR=1 FL=1
MENALTTEHGISVGNLSVHQINGWHDTNDVRTAKFDVHSFAR